jgi:hypothetical protein
MYWIGYFLQFPFNDRLITLPSIGAHNTLRISGEKCVPPGLKVSYTTEFNTNAFWIIYCTIKFTKYKTHYERSFGNNNIKKKLIIKI